MPRLLISAGTTDGALLLGDGEREPFRALAEGNFRGMCRSDGLAYAVTAEGRLFEITPENGACQQIAELGWEECHDLRRLGEHYYLVATQSNTIIRYDLTWREVDRRVLFARDDDILHVNSLCLRGDDESDGLYVSVFTLTPGTRKEKRLKHVWKRDGRVLLLDWQTGRWTPVSQPLGQPHSLTVTDGHLVLCNSYWRELCALDPTTGVTQRLAGTPGWCRGLAFDEQVGRKRCWVGISANRRRLLKWRGRYGQIAVYETATEHGPLPRWRLQRQLPAPAAEIYDLEVLD